MYFVVIERKKKLKKKKFLYAPCKFRKTLKKQKFNLQKEII